MKIYIQVQHSQEEGGHQRPRLLVAETSSSAAEVVGALNAITEKLGRICTVPAAAHELNLLSLLPRDLQEAGIASGEGTEGSVTLHVQRTNEASGAPGQGDVTALSYRVEG